jgi:disulfide bond formation protein DsbB
MINLISQLLPVAVLISHLLFAFVVLAYVYRGSWGAKTIGYIRSHGVLVGIDIALITVLGSFFYSWVLGYPPCELCWWQRVFLFPTLVLFVVAWKRGDKLVFSYVTPLASAALIIALYQVLAQTTGLSLTDCTAVGGACSKVYVKAFGYITIPVMGVTSAAYLLLLSFINRKHE